MRQGVIDLGFEIELEAFLKKDIDVDADNPRGPALALEILAAIQSGDAAYRSNSRIVFPWGVAYAELASIVEMNSCPANSVDGIVDSLRIVAARANRAAARALPDRLGSLHVVNDDLSAPPPSLAPSGTVSRGGGFHINVSAPREHYERTRELLLVTCAALAMTTGPGGFVRSRDGGFHVVRDPRSFHVFKGDGSSGHFRRKPLSKSARGFDRFELLALGFTPGLADVEIRSALLILMTAFAGQLPALKLASLPLATPPGVTSVDLDIGMGEIRPDMKTVELCRRLIDLLLPFRESETALVSGAIKGFDLFCRLVDALSRKATAEEIAREVGTGWSVQQAAFARICDEASTPFPRGGESTETHPIFDQLATLSLRSCGVYEVDETLRFLAEQSGAGRPPADLWWQYGLQEGPLDSPRDAGDAAWEHLDAVRQGKRTNWVSANNPLPGVLGAKTRAAKESSCD